MRCLWGAPHFVSFTKYKVSKICTGISYDKPYEPSMDSSRKAIEFDMSLLLSIARGERSVSE